MYITLAYFRFLLQLVPSQIYPVVVTTINVKDDMDVCITRFHTAAVTCTFQWGVSQKYSLVQSSGESLLVLAFLVYLICISKKG